MATMKQLEDALLAADRAGNTEDATKLAQEIRRRRDTSGPMKFGEAIKYGAQGVNKGLLADVAGGAVDLVNQAPRLVNLLPGEQGVGPMSERPIGGSKWWGDQLSAAGMGYGTIENVPEKYRPIARGGEVVGQSVPFAAAPLARAGQLGARTLQTTYANPLTGAKAVSGGGTFSPVVQAAQSSPAIFAAGEGSAALGAGVGAGIAEKLAPGDQWAALGGEVVGGVVNPASVLLMASRRASETVNRAVGTLTQEGRKRSAAGVLQNALTTVGEDPTRLSKDLVKLDPDVPSMTAGMQAESPTLLALERRLMRDSPGYGADVQDQLRSAVDETNASIRAAIDSGDPAAMQAAVEARMQYYDGLIKARLLQAQEKAQEAAGKVIPANPRDRSEANLQAREILEGAIEDARLTERELWSKIDRDTPVETPALREGVAKAREGLLAGEELQIGKPIRDAIARAVNPVGADDPEFNLVLDVLRGKRAAPKEPQSLTDFLVGAGGLREESGELATMGINSRARPGLVNNKGGMQFDDAAEAAWEAGYFPELPERPSVREFLDVLSDDFNRRAVRYDPAQEEEARLYDLLRATDEAVNQRGLDLKNMTNAEARSALQGLPELSMATSGNLLTLRSRLLSEARRLRTGQTPNRDGARRLSILADAILQDLGQLPGTEEARAFSRALNENLTQGFPGRVLGPSGNGGASIAPEMTLERGIGQGGPQAAVNARQMRSAADFASGRGAEMSDAQGDVIRSMAEQTVNPSTGQVDAGKLANFRRRNRDLLEQFPDLNTAFADAEQAQALANRITTRSRDQRKVLQESALAKAAGVEDPRRAVAAILNGARPTGGVSQLVKTVQRAGPDAVNGLRGVVMDVVMDRSTLPNGLLSGEQILQFLDGRAGQFLQDRGVITPSQAERVRVLAEKAQQVEWALASSRELDEVISDADALTDLLMRVAGSTLATRGVFSGVTGGGNQLIVASAGSKAFRRLFDKLPQQRVRDVLQDAVRDPRLMSDLLAMSPNAPQSKPWQRVHAYLLQAGYLEPSDTQPQEDERSGGPALSISDGGRGDSPVPEEMQGAR